MNKQNDKTTTATDATPAIFTWARDHTERVMALIQDRFGLDRFSDCDVCKGKISLDVAATVTASKPHLVPIWRACPECLVRDRMKRSGVPEMLLAARMDNWKVRADADKNVLGKVSGFLWGHSAGFLILASPEFGNGKTHLAVSVLREYAKVGTSARFTTQSEILRCIRRRYNNPNCEDVVLTLSEVKLLVIDDIGVSGGGKDEQPALYDIMAERYANRRKTVLTTNLSPDEFRDIISDRMSDRMREATFAWVTIHGASHRAEKRNAYLGR